MNVSSCLYQSELSVSSCKHKIYNYKNVKEFNFCRNADLNYKSTRKYKFTLEKMTYLHFTDENIVKRVNSLACLFNILSDTVGQQFVYNFLEVGALDVARDYLHHLFTDLPDLNQKTNSLYFPNDQSSTHYVTYFRYYSELINILRR